MMFCPECRALLVPAEGKLRCGRCGYTAEVPNESHSVTAEGKEREFVVVADEVKVLPRTRAECPKCGHLEAEWHIRQTRASDEPETRFLRCLSCGHTWREYG